MITRTLKNLEKYCTDYKKIENYEEAVKSPLRYDLHHRLEIDEMQTRSDLIFLHLYFHRPPEELVFLEHGEHMRLHKANLSEETRQIISEALKGKHCSQDTRQKISEALKGKHCSQDTRRKISENNSRYWKGQHRSAETRQKIAEGMKGKHWHLSAETRKRISEARKGRHWHLENGRRIYTD
jgi:hypothetical protein